VWVPGPGWRGRGPLGDGRLARGVAVWNEHDTTSLPDFLTEDLVWIDPLLSEPARGVDGVRRFMEACWSSMPDLHFAITGPYCLADDAQALMVPWKMTGTHLALRPPGLAPAGRSVDVDGIDVDRFRGQKGAHYAAHYDNAQVARELGLLPATGSRAERRVVALQRLRGRFGSRRR
jgi:hypothetical protein